MDKPDDRLADKFSISSNRSSILHKPDIEISVLLDEWLISVEYFDNKSKTSLIWEDSAGLAVEVIVLYVELSKILM